MGEDNKCGPMGNEGCASIHFNNITSDGALELTPLQNDLQDSNNDEHMPTLKAGIRCQCSRSEAMCMGVRDCSRNQVL